MTTGVRPFVAGDLAEVVDLAARVALERSARTGSVTDRDAVESVSDGVASFLDQAGREAVVACEDGRVVAFLGSIASRLTPQDEGWTYLPPLNCLVPVSGALARDPGAAARWWPTMLEVLRGAARRVGIDRMSAQALVGDVVAGAVWRSAGLRPDTLLAMRPLSPLGPEVEVPANVRPARETDVPALAALLLEEIVHHARTTRCGVSPDQSPETLTRVASGWTDHEAPENVGRAFVAEVGETVAGVVVVDVLTIPERSPAAFTLPARHGYIGLASTAGTHRGRGIGGALTVRALQWLRALPEPPSTVGLHYAADNPLGAPFWSGRGFVPVLEMLSIED